MLGLMILVVAGFGAPLRAADRNIDESRIPELKAAILFKITTFVSWTDAVLPPSGGEIRLGLICDDCCTPAFFALRGQRIQGRTLEVVTFDSLSQVRGCQLLYTCEGEPGGGNAEGLVEFLADTEGVLTFGDGELFNAQGGMIHLGLDAEDRMSFTVNRAAVNRGGLRLSSRLLRLAKLYEEEAR